MVRKSHNGPWKVIPDLPKLMHCWWWIENWTVGGSQAWLPTCLPRLFSLKSFINLRHQFLTCSFVCLFGFFFFKFTHNPLGRILPTLLNACLLITCIHDERVLVFVSNPNPFGRLRIRFAVILGRLLTFLVLENFHQKKCFQVLERLETFPRISTKQALRLL